VSSIPIRLTVKIQRSLFLHISDKKSKMKPIVVASFLVILGVASGQLSCPSGWQGPSPSGKCYIVNKNPAAPWDAAAKVCAEVGAELGSIETNSEATFLQVNVYPSVNDWLVTGGRTVPYGSTNWRWADGSSLTYSNPASPSLNTALPQSQIGYFYINAFKSDPNFGKTYLDNAVAHPVLCQKKATVDSGAAQGGGAQGGAACGSGCGGCGSCCGSSSCGCGGCCGCNRC